MKKMENYELLDNIITLIGRLVETIKGVDEELI